MVTLILMTGKLALIRWLDLPRSVGLIIHPVLEAVFLILLTHWCMRI